MVIPGITYNGKWKMRKVEKKSEINNIYYQIIVVIPICKEEIQNFILLEQPYVQMCTRIGRN